jgi:hypothetical protein
MRSNLATYALPVLLVACSSGAGGAPDQSADAIQKSGLTKVQADVAKTFNPNRPPAEFKGDIPGVDAADVENYYENESYTAKYKLKANGQDVFAILGNIVDADFEVAILDAKGALLTSGSYLSTQGAKWTWDATPQVYSHAGDADLIREATDYIGKNFDPNKLPAEFKGTIPGTHAPVAEKNYENDNFVANYELEAAHDTIYLVLGNTVDADYEIAVFDSTGRLVASGSYEGFGAAKWVWDARARIRPAQQ